LVRTPAILQPKIRRQHVLAGFILDFHCIKLQLAIEQSSAHHYTPEGKSRDAKRTAILERQNVTVIRFPNSEVLEKLEAVIAKLEGLGVTRKSPLMPVARATPKVSPQRTVGTLAIPPEVVLNNWHTFSRALEHSQ
jgi:very-short-patch-repair endonuclease